MADHLPANVIHLDNDEIVVRLSEEHEFLLNNQEVAFGYGVTSDNIRRHKADHGDELVEGKHWTTVRNTHGGEPATLWTKRGIIRLGFFIRSERAKKFRDAAEDLIIRQSQPQQLVEYSAIQQRIKQLEDKVISEQLSPHDEGYCFFLIEQGHGFLGVGQVAEIEYNHPHINLKHNLGVLIKQGKINAVPYGYTKNRKN